MPYVFFGLICTFWGASFILMKKAAPHFSANAIAAGRILGGAAVLGVFLWWRGHKISLRKSDFLPVAFAIVASFLWPYPLQPKLVVLHGSGFIGMTVGFTPLLTILVSIPLLSIYPTRRQVVGVLGALVCLAALMVDGVYRAIPLTDLLLAFTIPLGYALTNTIVRRTLAHVAPMDLTFVCLLTSGLLLLPFSFGPPASKFNPDEIPLWQAMTAVAVLGIFGTGVAMSLFNKLVRDQGPLFAGMVTNLVPVGAVLWGSLDSEKVTPLQLFSLVGLIAMVSVVQFGAAAAPVIKMETVPPASSDTIALNETK